MAVQVLHLALVAHLLHTQVAVQVLLKQAELLEQVVLEVEVMEQLVEVQELQELPIQVAAVVVVGIGQVQDLVQAVQA
jgi:hypothetical protein